MSKTTSNSSYHSQVLTSGSSPGVAVVKFVTNKTSPEKTVKKAAAKIAEELTKQLQGQTLVAKN